jgi:hypothetical protein
MFLTAFGGRSEAPADPSAAVAIVSTDLQAKTRAPRSADAMFANDNMNSEVILAALAPLPIGAARVQRPWREADDIRRLPPEGVKETWGGPAFPCERLEFVEQPPGLSRGIAWLRCQSVGRLGLRESAAC